MDSVPGPAAGTRTRISAVLTLLVALVVVDVDPASTRASSTGSKTAAAPAVIAIVERGMNVLHDDFALPGGRDIRLPEGVPPVTAVTLPDAGTFQERMELAQQGPLGSMTPDTLYYVRGTRILIYSSGQSSNNDVFADRSHGTGVAGAAVGVKHGTNPDALLVIVPDAGPAGWEWLARQKWIDAVSTSYVTVLHGTSRCHEARFVEDIVDEGRLVFSAVGNGEQAGEILSPSGVPQAYQVGGVDPDGRTYLPRLGGYLSTSNRPYETGDRFEFESADSESSSGSMGFGGTSGATPSTAGRATSLIQHAREILGSRFTGARGGKLARARGDARPPETGPLADGDLTATELTDVLHHIAQPAEPASPARYLLEGFGALNTDGVMAVGETILSGTAEMPERAQEQAMHEQVEAARGAAFFEGRCN